MIRFSPLFILILTNHLFVAPASGNVLAKAASEAVEFAAKKFGIRGLGRAAREAAETALVKAAKQHGDEVFEIVRKGGLEAIEQGAKHGDDFWKYAKLHPGAARSLALHADDLLPAVRRVGPELLEVEAKNPGLGLKVVQSFGDDGAKTLAKAAPEDVPRLLGYAEKAPDAATKRALLDHYLKSRNPRAMLEALNWKHIMAAGLSLGAITAAYQVSDGYQVASINQSEGIREGLRTAAKEDPKAFLESVEKQNSPWYAGWLDKFSWVFVLGLAVLLASLLVPVMVWSWRKSRRPPPSDSEEKPVSSSKETP